MVSNMWALIQNGTVSEITDIDPNGRFHESLVWVSCNGGVKPGDIYDGLTFSRPSINYPDTAIPHSVTWRQANLALIEVGKYDDVQALLSVIEDPIEKLKAEVEYQSPTYERSSPFLQSVWSEIGGTESELDDLFILANTL